MSIDAEHVQAVYARADCLHSAAEIDAALDRLAGEISHAFHATVPLVLCIMNGGLVPTGRLLPRLDIPLRLDYLHATRYRGATAGGELKWIRRPGTGLQDQHVLLIDDILDEGYTLQAVSRACETAGAASIRSAVLVKKRHDRCVDYSADFVGLEVEDRYVFGAGMDYKGYLRNVPGIYALSPEDEARALAQNPAPDPEFNMTRTAIDD